MKFLSLSLVVGCIAMLAAAQTGSAQDPRTVKVLGCLQGDGSDERPWVLAGVAIPPATVAPPEGGGGGGRGGGGRGAGAAAPAAGAQGQAPAAGGGGRGNRGGGGAAAAPVAPPAPVQLVDLRLTGGMNMSLWRGMKIEVEGTLGPRPGTGLQELRATSAHSVQGLCTPK